MGDSNAKTCSTMYMVFAWPGLGLCPGFPGNDEFSIDFPEEKEAGSCRGHIKVSTNFSFAYIQVFNDAAAAAPRFAALPRRLMRASKC